ncbi:hypothetical protein IFVP182_C2140017 [Vibrio parahaemolyticus]
MSLCSVAHERCYMLLVLILIIPKSDSNHFISSYMGFVA